jgi:hypothetical protein
MHRAKVPQKEKERQDIYKQASRVSAEANVAYDNKKHI